MDEPRLQEIKPQVWGWHVLNEVLAQFSRSRMKSGRVMRARAYSGPLPFIAGFGAASVVVGQIAGAVECAGFVNKGDDGFGLNVMKSFS